MLFSSTLALLSVAIGVQAQGAPIGLTPPGGSPPGCVSTRSGRFQVQNVRLSARSLERREGDCSDPSTLVVRLDGGILTDALGRIGAIVSNRQFQFDGPPPQTGSIYTGGWSICPNSSLALGPSTVFYQCLSGGFFNLYDQPIRSDCVEIHQQLLPCANAGTAPVVPSAASSASSAASPPSTTSSSTLVSQQPDGQPTASSALVVSSAVSQQSDGQPTVGPPRTPVTQISDGQPQATAPSNATLSASPPVVTGAAPHLLASGAIAALGVAAAFLL